MSIWQAVKLTIFPPKDCEPILKRHPVVFITALAILFIFSFPVILFDYVRKRQWRW